MASFRDLSFNNGEYIQQYTGIPLEQLQKTGDVLSARHYSNLAELSQLKLLAEQEKASMLPGAKSLVDQHINQIDEALGELASSGAENATAKVQAMANSYLGNQNRLLSLARAKEVAKMQDTINDVTTKSGREAVYDKNKLQEMMNASPTILDKDGNEVVNPLYNQPFNLQVQAYQEPNEEFSKILKELSPDQWLSQGLTQEELLQFKKENTNLQSITDIIPKFVKWAETRGISQDRIDRLQQSLFSAYKNTNAYQQQKEFFNATDDSQLQKMMDYAKLIPYSQRQTHITQVSGGGSGDGKNDPSKIPTGVESVGVRPGSKIKMDYIPENINPPVAPVQPAAPQYQIKGSPQVVQNKNTGEAYTNNPTAYEKAYDTYLQNTKQYEQDLQRLVSDANLSRSIFGGNPIDVSTESGRRAAQAAVRKYYDWANNRMENQTIDKVALEVKPGTVDDDGNLVHDVKTLTADVMNNLSRRKLWSLPDQEGNSVQDNNQETRDDWKDLIQSKPENVVASGYLNEFGPEAAAAGPEFIGGPVIQVRDPETGKLKQFAVTLSEGELATPKVQRKQIAGQLYQAFGSKPGQEVDTEVKVFTASDGWVKLPFKGQELVGQQREATLEAMRASDPKNYEIAKQYPRMYRVQLPGHTEPLIYYTLDQVGRELQNSRQ